MFVSAGLTVATRPYQTPEGPHFCGWIWKCDKGPGNFAVDLERGTWSECGTLTRNRPAAELAARVAELRAAAAKTESAGSITEPAETITPPASAPEPVPATDIPRAIAPLDPAAAAWLEECRGKGIEIEAAPWDKDGNSFRGWYRGRDLTLHVRQRGALYGVQIPSGRSWRPFTIDMALEAIEDELAGRPVDEVQTLITTPQLATPSPPAAADPPAVDGRQFRTTRPIPRTGGSIPAGSLLTLTALHPERTCYQPIADRGLVRQRIMWEEEPVGLRGNFRAADGRTVCDYPLDQLELT